MKPSPELIRLVDKCLSKRITRTEMARLEELLEDENALRYYLEIADIEGNLPLALDAGVELGAPSNTHSLFSRFKKPLTLAAAAIVIFFGGVFSGKQLAAPTGPPAENLANTSSEPYYSDNAAAITSLIGVTWEGDAPNSIRLSNNSDAIAMKSGLMELTFKSGVRSLIEGPAVIRVTGDNMAELSRGRMVADVPKGAEGFTVEYPDGKVVDLGTEFAINVPQDQKGAEVGVFRGEVEIYDRKQNTPRKILENHAVVQISGSRNPFASIPFHRDEYIRELPTREFPWELPKKASSKPTTLDFDVSHLVWKAGDYRAVIKWMQGHDALVIHKADLLLNGNVITSDNHIGRTGQFNQTTNNTYSFKISERQHKKGRWTLRITVRSDIRRGKSLGSFSPDSSGILLFEDSQSIQTTDASFVGTWEYHHNGKAHRRVFTSDHRAQLIIEGKKTASHDNATWKVENGILILSIVEPHGIIHELHLLRNDRELVFVNCPYRNAIKVNP